MMDSSSMKYAQEAYLKEHDVRPGGNPVKETFVDPLIRAMEHARSLAEHAERLEERTLGPWKTDSDKAAEPALVSPNGVFGSIEFAGRDIEDSLRRIQRVLEAIGKALP